MLPIPEKPTHNNDMQEFTLSIDVQLNDGDLELARLAVAETIDELIGEALAGGAFDFASDVEILGYHVITDD